MAISNLTLLYGICYSLGVCISRTNWPRKSCIQINSHILWNISFVISDTLPQSMVQFTRGT